MESRGDDVTYVSNLDTHRDSMDHLRARGLLSVGHDEYYTREMFDALIAGKIDPDTFGDIYFDKIEDRLMGLVPHEFKALLVRRS